jgi:penicillin-binding protein 2
MRFKIFYISIIIAFSVVALRLFFMQVMRGHYYLSASKRNAIRIIPEKAVRGRILDRNGLVIAEDRLSLNVAIIPQSVRKRAILLRQLSRVLGVSEEILELRYAQNISAPFAPVVIAENIDRLKALLLAERVNELPGVIIEYEPIRYYKYGSVASHILGYLGMPQTVWYDLGEYGFSVSSYVGVEGVEKYMDSYLHGQDGGMQIEVDNQGRQVSMLGVRLPEQGTDITLTIDMRIQTALEKLLSERRGAAVFMNPFNGEILAMASVPAFDPNDFVQKRSSKQRMDYLTAAEAPLFNRAVRGQYPPGSVFKVVTTLAGLTSAKITTQTQFFCPGQKQIGRRIFKCWSEHGTQNLKEAITHSCNVYFYSLGLAVGADALSEYAKVFQFGKITGIDLPKEEPGFIPSPRWRAEFEGGAWYQGDTANMAIGQGGILVTPLQIARMMATVANSGYLVRPHLIKKVASKTVLYKNPSKTNMNFKFLSFLKGALRSVVAEETGTARLLESSHIKAAGKTGTAQISGGRKHGWFAGFAPFDAPQMAFVIFLERSEGSGAAVLLARDLFNELQNQKIISFSEPAEN